MRLGCAEAPRKGEGPSITAFSLRCYCLPVLPSFCPQSHHNLLPLLCFLLCRSICSHNIFHSALQFMTWLFIFITRINSLRTWIALIDRYISNGLHDLQRLKAWVLSFKSWQVLKLATWLWAGYLIAHTLNIFYVSKMGINQEYMEAQHGNGIYP